MAGYSQRPLVDKLGIKSGMSCVFLHEPASIQAVLQLPPNVHRFTHLMKHSLYIHSFVATKNMLVEEFVNCRDFLDKKGMIWVSWPKQSSNINTDLNENIIREIGLQSGMVDVKVCAIDDDWSGLKFVFRLKDRG